MGRWIFRLLMLLLGIGGFLLGLLQLGHWSRSQLQENYRPQFQISFTQIDCPAPPTMDRQKFLEEVQYYGKWPNQVLLLDENLTEKLSASFALHPWVEKVEGIKIGPGKQIRAHLTFRKPALAVKWEKGLRVVDRHGVLLRPDAPTAGLPIYESLVLPPKGPAGTLWGDPGIEARLRVLP